MKIENRFEFENWNVPVTEFLFFPVVARPTIQKEPPLFYFHTKLTSIIFCFFFSEKIKLRRGFYN